MRMTSRDKELVFLALSLGMVAVSWFGGVKLINKKTAELTVQRTELQSEYDERMRVLEKKDEYLNDTKNNNDAYRMLLAQYPAGISQVEQILFVTGLEEHFNTQIVSVSYTDEEEIYSFQSTEQGNTIPYTLVKAGIQIPVTLEYSQWKDFMDYVFSHQDKSTIPEVSATFDAVSGNVAATVTFNQYAIKGEDRISEEPKITVPLGTDNIFKSGTALAYNGGKAEQAEAIKKDYDCYVMLYPSASDVMAKVVAGVDDEEKVTSGKNEEETLSIVAQEADGAYSLTYTLGDDRPHVLYDVTGDTLDIYVLSSPRMGAEDRNGVKVNVDNQTTKQLRIAVAGDDRTKPRFTVESQKGNVEILN
ncbi:MAG: hypothetical protein RRZ63_03565 [Clostridium sp.]